MRGRQPGDDLAVKAARAQDDPVAVDAHQQVTERDLLTQRGTGPAEIGDLVIAQERAAEYVARPALRQVHDLSEYAVRLAAFLGAQVVADPFAQRRGGGAETAEPPGPRRAADGADHHLVVV